MRSPRCRLAASRWLVWAACVATAPLLAACLDAAPCAEPKCSDSTDPSDDSTWDEVRQLTLPRGKMLEAGIAMTEGDAIEIEFLSEGEPVVWNLHSHDGIERPRFSQGRGSSDAFEFVAPHDGEFWSLWTNDASDAVDVEVRFRVHGAAFQGWRDER